MECGRHGTIILHLCEHWTCLYHEHRRILNANFYSAILNYTNYDVDLTIFTLLNILVTLLINF